MPKAKGRHVSGFFFKSLCHGCCVLFLLVFPSLSFVFGGPGPGFWGCRQIFVTWSKTILPEWSEGREDKQSRETSCGMNWNKTEGHHETAALMVTGHLAMYLLQREGLKETASLSRLIRCLLWRMGCLPSSWTQSADAFQAAPKPW